MSINRFESSICRSKATHTRTDRRIDCHPYNIHHLITWLIWRIFFCCIVCVLQQYFPVDCPIDRILTCGQSLQVIGVTNSENKAFFRRHTVPLMLHSNRCLDFYLFFRKQMSIIFKKTCVSRITHTHTPWQTLFKINCVQFGIQRILDYFLGSGFFFSDLIYTPDKAGWKIENHFTGENWKNFF